MRQFDEWRIKTFERDEAGRHPDAATAPQLLLQKIEMATRMATISRSNAELDERLAE